MLSLGLSHLGLLEEVEKEGHKKPGQRPDKLI